MSRSPRPPRHQASSPIENVEDRRHPARSGEADGLEPTELQVRHDLPAHARPDRDMDLAELEVLAHRAKEPADTPVVHAPIIAGAALLRLTW